MSLLLQFGLYSENSRQGAYMYIKAINLSIKVANVRKVISIKCSFLFLKLFFTLFTYYLLIYWLFFFHYKTERILLTDYNYYILNHNVEWWLLVCEMVKRIFKRKSLDWVISLILNTDFVFKNILIIAILYSEEHYKRATLQLYINKFFWNVSLEKLLDQST